MGKGCESFIQRKVNDKIVKSWKAELNLFYKGKQTKVYKKECFKNYSADD